MRKHVAAGAGAGLGLACAGTALAQPTFISASRTVSAETGGGTQTFTTATLGAWNQTASSSYPIGSAGAIAIQASDFSTEWISYRGSTQAWNLNAYTAIATNTFEVSFSLPSATPYEFVRPPTARLANVSIGLSNGFYYWYGSGVGDVPLHATGVLPAGTFTLRVAMDSEAPWSYPDWVEDGAAEFTLHLPSPGPSCILLAAALGAFGRRRRSPA